MRSQSHDELSVVLNSYRQSKKKVKRLGWGIVAMAVGLLSLLAVNVLATTIGVSLTQQFKVKPDGSPVLEVDSPPTIPLPSSRPKTLSTSSLSAT